MADHVMTIMEATVEVTKSAVPLSNGTLVNQAESVAKFMDIVFRKLSELEKARIQGTL
jgi:hypothetical protein